MREVDPRLSLNLEHLDAAAHLDDISKHAKDLEKLRSACSHSGELEELQDLLHFPEEVALRLADTEYQLFYQVPPIDYLRQVTVDLGGVGAAPPPPQHGENPTAPSAAAPAAAAPSQVGAATTGTARSTVASLIKRFNEVSAWVTQLIISQPTHDERRAVLSCILRVALSCWNIGNFNGAMEIIAGLKSTKLRPFWLSITEKEPLPILDFLSAALLSAEYDRALSRALDMAECRVVPFFGAFLRELREILASTPSLIMLEPQQVQSTHHRESMAGITRAESLKSDNVAVEHRDRSTSPAPPTTTTSTGEHHPGSAGAGGAGSASSVGGGSNRSSRENSECGPTPGGERHHRRHHHHHHHHHHHSHTTSNVSYSSPKHREQQRYHAHRQVFISDYDGEDHYFTRIGPGGLINLEKIYRTQAVMDHISMFHQHFHNRNRCSPNNNHFLDYLKSVSVAGGRVFQAAPPEKVELDEEYETEIDAYRPVQPLTNDHGVSFVSITSPLTGIDQHILQVLHHGTTVVMLESDGCSGGSGSGAGIGSGGDSMQGGRGAVLLYVRLDRAGVTLTWSRPSWSALRAGSLYYDNDIASTSTTSASSHFVIDFNLSANPEETLSSGLLAKLSAQSGVEMNPSGSTLDEGFLDLMHVKELALGVRESEKEPEILVIARRFGIAYGSGSDPCCLSLMYGYSLNDNRILYMLLPPVLCRLWYTGLGWLIKGIARQLRLADRRILWLKEQYLQLYYEDRCCCGPLAADAIRAFGGRDWSFATVLPGGVQPGTDPSALKREASVKIKKKQLIASKRDSRTHLLDPIPLPIATDTYWRNPAAHHRQSTPARFSEPQPDVARHHSLGHLAYTSQPSKFERDRHGSMEQLWHGRHPRVGFILYETQLDFVDFVALFRSFSLLMRKDLRDLFDQLAISYRSMSGTSTSPKVNGVKVSLELATSKKPQRIGLFTRNSASELAGVTTTNSQRKIFDAIAAASIFSNCAGIDSSNSQVITLSTFTKFLETRQMENWSASDVKALIQRHEPDPVLRSQDCLSFEGFARYLMDKDNFAFINEREVPKETDMGKPMSHYYIASSHNTYLTGHQLKGESSVELYSQVLQSGCRCVELDCWDGDDGYPMIYHGHTFTTKIAFTAVVEAINRNAFVTSPYPVILSLENHCSLHQQAKMAQIFQKVFGDRLVTNFLFDTDFCDEPVLPSPMQLKNRILIKNKKMTVDLPPSLSASHPSSIAAAVRSGAGMKHTGGRTSSIISNTSSSSFNDDFSDDEYDEDEEDENIDEKNLASILHPVSSGGSGGGSAETSPRTCVGAASHAISKTSSTKRGVISDDKLKKRSSQIAKELSDIVVYVQAIKFRGLNTVSPSSSVKQRPPVAPRTSSSGSSIMTVCSTTGSTSTVPGTGFDAHPKPNKIIFTVGTSGETDFPTSMEVEYAAASTAASLAKTARANFNHPCYQCSSINENTAKKLCRKQPLALVCHTQTQLMRTYPAGMRIDSSNFNPVIFWAFGIQMAALNYQTEDHSLHLNTALFESNGKCGYVPKPDVMWDRTHVMYRRFNPWDKEFDGLHSSQLLVNVVSGQYINQANINASTFVEVEIIGIPIDCNKQKTRVIQKNALNPIWNDTFYFRVMFQDLAFIRFSIFESPTSHLVAQRVLPLKCLRPGYRHLRLRNPQNKPLNMSTLFIYSRTEEESLDNTGATSSGKDTDDVDEKMTTPYTGISGTPLCVKRKMFFLMVYGVVSEEPYTILKITQESTTQDVLLQCMQKAGLPPERVNDHILVEEVARGWEKKDHELPATQRILDLHERPLQAQSKWKGEGRFLLKRMGDDPSSRAWLSSIRSVANREREALSCEKPNAWEEHDTFLVCIYNVSPEIPYAILKVPLGSTAQDVLAQALVKARRLEDPMNFVLVEELEWAGSGGHQQRALADDENVYSTQSHWQTIGRFILQERANATPTSLRRNRVTTNLRLATLDRISRGLSAARSAASNSIKAPVQAALSDPTTNKTSRKTSAGGIIRGKGNSEKETLATQQRSQSLQCQREVHSEGETLSDEENKESDLLSTVSRLKKVSLRKFKEWKS